MWGRRAAATWEVISWRPTTMSSDRENPSNAAAAAAAPDGSATDANTPDPIAPAVTEQPETVNATPETPAPSAPVSEEATAYAEAPAVPAATETHSEAPAADAEAAAAAEEAAGSQERSQRMQGFDEQHEHAASD